MAKATKEELEALEKEKHASDKIPIRKGVTISVPITYPDRTIWAQDICEMEPSWRQKFEDILAKASSLEDLKKAFQSEDAKQVRFYLARRVVDAGNMMVREKKKLDKKERAIIDYFYAYSEGVIKTMLQYQKEKQEWLEKQRKEQWIKKDKDRVYKFGEYPEFVKQGAKGRSKSLGDLGKTARYQAFSDYFAYRHGLDDGYYDYDGGYKASEKLAKYNGGYQRAHRYKRGGAAANSINFDDFYYDEDSEVASAYQGGLDDDYYVLVADEYDDNMDQNSYYHYGYDDSYKASEKLSVYDDEDNYYDIGGRLGNYYESKVKAKQGRNHRNRYARRGLMVDMADGDISGDPAGLILSVILFVGFIALFVVVYSRYKMGKTGMDEKYRKMEKQIINGGEDKDEDQV